MSDNDLNHPTLNLTEQEKRAYGFLFAQADSDQLGVVTGERAVAFFERTKVSPNVLGEIWQIADTENRGLLTKPGFCMVLRLIGHYQAGKEPSAELAFKPAPIPRFDGLQIPGVSAPVGPGAAVPSPTGAQFPINALQPQLSGQAPIRVPPLDAQKVQQYSSLFERSGMQNGSLDGTTAKNIFERAGLPNEVLGKIWTLADRQQRGFLDQTEFIVAMHLLMSMKTRTMTALPNTLPPGLYEAAARRGIPPPPGSRDGPPIVRGPPSRQFTGGSVGVPARTQSPLAQPAGFSTPAPQAPQPTGLPWLVTTQEKAKYDQFFSTIDIQGRGVITGDQAVSFFSDSRLPEDTLATIWDLADINSEGQLNRDEFAVAMYLIRQQRAPNPAPLPAFLPPALVPPSMRQQQQQGQSTAPVFDNASNSRNLPKSAADDLFGLDEPTAGATQQPALQPQMTGLQTQTTGTQDPFAGSMPASPSSPQHFQPQSQQPASTVFKPFMPTSAFGAALTQQHTGGSTSPNQRAFQPPSAQPSHLRQTSAAEDDLLGDNVTHAEEASKITNDTTELANMSSQIGNLRTQMEQTQSKRGQTQADVTATQTQKRDLELRLQQFRAQYEAEVRTVKELEQQLAASRDSTKKLSQELAMLEGTYQDLQTQHSSVTQQLQADQQENANLKQRIGQLNAEVARLKPEIEKMKLDARQQKGLVSINKKQLATSEAERDRLEGERTDLEREAAERAAAARNVPAEQPASHFGRDAAAATGLAAAGTAAFGAYEMRKEHQTTEGVISPGSAMHSLTNPFFRKASTEGANERAVSPPATSSTGAPTPSAFDALFGPSAAFAPTGQSISRTGTPPSTSFIGRSIPAATTSAAVPQHGMTDSVQSVSSVGEPTPSATPPLSDQAKDSPIAAIDPPPPPPENRQFLPSELPVRPLPDRSQEESDASSTRVLPPASRMGGTETPREPFESRVASPTPAAVAETVPGAFPSDELQPTTSAQEVVPEDEPTAAPGHPPAPQNARDDFDSAFASFGDSEKARDATAEAEDPFAPGSSQQANGGYSSEFPPIQSLEPEDEESSDDEEADRPEGTPATHGAAALAPPAASAPSASEPAPEANIAGARPAIATVDSTLSDLPGVSAQQSPPSYEQSDAQTHGGSGERTDANHFPPEFGGLLPAREDPTSPPPPAGGPPVAIATNSREQEVPTSYAAPERTTTGSSSLYPNTVPQTPTSNDIFHDANSRPFSTVTEATPTQPAQTVGGPTRSQNAFDDFDDFAGLSEAKEAERTGTDFDSSFFSNSTRSVDEFNPAFDSPAASMTNTMASSQQTPLAPSSHGDSFPGFQPNNSSSSPFDTTGRIQSRIQSTPQNGQHDWDAIFSGLDSSKTVDTSLNTTGHDDPWSTPAAAATNGDTSAAKTPTPASPVRTFTARPADKAAQIGRAITPGTEHDDPILKRLTGMGYPRTAALNALEMYDYVSFPQSIGPQTCGVR
ncbi:hypothetical protein BAUCODRAFT_24304 [Baudoinia panamericana UAMH 10762]|uniref:Uncharacterized protein n=1 Tax=Baudoinia panamericana (strain UAMH 10762) TaxID=717646 RepID=M2LQ76_BAUPA|nr:uncharacterized protein BAUCODRAFT_24304 [Baudoinia panamericana UAMH 10762]EMC96552.1 hypothetical protein BAUCODRAFT_24304 [Baudoinia panamericana UAMH 10762]